MDWLTFSSPQILIKHGSLTKRFHENHFSIQDDHNLRLHNLDLPVGKIVTAFVENGLEVSEAHTCEESLEDYFKRVTGGEGIA